MAGIAPGWIQAGRSMCSSSLTYWPSRHRHSLQPSVTRSPQGLAMQLRWSAAFCVCVKSHLHASLNSKFFPGVISPDSHLKGREGKKRKGWNRKGNGRDWEGEGD
jgi:hypothetical protein